MNSPRDLGMQLALDHAERDCENWGSLAIAFLHRHARRHREFISEDVSDAAREYGLIAPVSARAWGAVFKRARRLGIISVAGMGRSRLRASPTYLWRSNVYRTEGEWA